MLMRLRNVINVKTLITVKTNRKCFNVKTIKYENIAKIYTHRHKIFIINYLSIAQVKTGFSFNLFLLLKAS